MLRAGGADGDRGAGRRSELDANEQISPYSYVLLGKTHTLATKAIISGLKIRKEFTKHYIASTKSRDGLPREQLCPDQDIS